MPEIPLDYRTTNALWGSVFVETLVRCGVTRAVISPGSRSTPLTLAFARHAAVEAIPVLDERSAAFFALGLSKRHRSPTVLLCTSGTAGANYFPAVIEAQESGVPLLIITADRPPEMRECASGQTIDQQKLFGSHVSWYCELAVPEPTLERLSYLRQTVAHAVRRTQLSHGGPVHLNAPFRDPLAPVADSSAKPLEGKIDGEFFSHLGPIDATSGTVVWQRPTAARGVIVAGPDSPAKPAEYAAAVGRLAVSLGWPILADALSPLRHYAVSGAVVVSAYDTILRAETVARDLTPRTVLCCGGWPTSKVMRTWLEKSGAEIALVSPFASNRDALHGRTRHLSVSADQIAPVAAGTPDLRYLALWAEAEQLARARFDEVISAEQGVVEPAIAAQLARYIPPDSALFVASSMPVRDVEYFWPPDDRRRRIYFNRGANGIDGTMSTALGIAHDSMPAVLLTGDLAFLHDSNGLLLRAHFRGSLTVILINNQGGGIFEHLPVAQFEPPFEAFFATPQQVDFAALCAAHGIPHQRVPSTADLGPLLAALPSKGIRVLELQTNRKRDASLRKKLFAETAQLIERERKTRW